MPGCTFGAVAFCLKSFQRAPKNLGVALRFMAKAMEPQKSALLLTTAV